MGMPQEPDSLEFAGYLGVLRRRWWVVLAGACVGLLAAVAYVAVTPKAYTATTTVNVTSVGLAQNAGGSVASGRTSSAINLDTEVQIIQSGAVAAIAARTLHSPLTPTALVAHVSVTVPANSSVLQIGCQAASARSAAACANAFGAAYLRNRTASAASTTKAQLRTVQGELATLQRRTAQLTIQIHSLPVNSPQRASAEAQVQTASSQLRALANQAAALTAQEAASSGGSILTSATPPGKASSPKKTIVLLGGLAAGLLIGLIAAFAWDRRDKRIRDARNLGQLGAPVLLTLSGQDLDGRPLAPARSAAALEFADLGRSMSAGPGPDHRLLLVAGASAGHSTSVVSANLAVALARTHSSVVLVCPGGQGTAELLGLPEPRELGAWDTARLAAGELSLDDVAMRPPGFPALRIVVLGADLRDLQREHARRLAGRLAGHAGATVIEAPVPGDGPDSLALAEFCGSALVTIETSVTRRPEAEDAIRRLGRLGTPVAGLVLVPRLRMPAPAPRDARRVPPEPASARAGRAESGPDEPVPPGPASPAESAGAAGTSAADPDASWPDQAGRGKPAVSAQAPANASDHPGGN